MRDPWTRKDNLSTEKKLKWDPNSYKKINSRYIQDLNVSTKSLEENPELFSDLEVQKHFYKQETKNTNHKRDNLYIQLLCSHILMKGKDKS